MIKPLGGGGMGEVWLAEQTNPVRRSVAIKFIRSGQETPEILARFEAERQALALMTHPHIAQVFDGGVAPGQRPFIVMEYVAGIPITDFCGKRKLSVRERLALFLAVCAAVRHAHQKGVIHRDLKPSNVLIAETDGAAQPKVIDFGIAKAMGVKLFEHSFATASGAVVGTPLYMSPEQAGPNPSDVDTRTDVFALGVLLYELLTGTTPISKKMVRSIAVFDLLRMIEAAEVEPPSERAAREPGETAPPGSPIFLRKVLRRELDWIVLKALARERERRYDSVTALAEDVVQYLADRPVKAGPPGRWYRVRKFAQRNWIRLAVGSLISVAGFGVAVSSWRVWNADRKTREATENAKAAHELSEYAFRSREMVAFRGEWLLVQQYFDGRMVYDHALLPPLQRAQLRQKLETDLLKKFERLKPIPLDSKSVIDLLVEVGFRKEVADAYARHEQPERGIGHLERAIAICEHLGLPDSGMPPDARGMVPLGWTLVALADLLERSGRTAEIGPLLHRAEDKLARQSSLLGRKQALAGIRGAQLASLGQYADAEDLLIARYRDLTDPDNPQNELLPEERKATVRRLIALYQAWGKPDQAAIWRARLPQAMAADAGRDGRGDDAGR